LSSPSLPFFLSYSNGRWGHVEFSYRTIQPQETPESTSSPRHDSDRLGIVSREWVTGTDISPTGTASVPAETGARPSGTGSVPGLIGWFGAGSPSTTRGRRPSRPRRMLSRQSRWFTRPGHCPSQPGHCPSPLKWGGEDRDGPPPDRDLVRSDRGNVSPGRDAIRPDLLRPAIVRCGFTNDRENIRNRRAEVRSD